MGIIYIETLKRMFHRVASKETAMAVTSAECNNCTLSIYFIRNNPDDRDFALMVSLSGHVQYYGSDMRFMETEEDRALEVIKDVLTKVNTIRGMRFMLKDGQRELYAR